MLSSHPRLVVPRRRASSHCSIRHADPLPDDVIEDYLRSCVGHWWWQDLGLDDEAFGRAVRCGTRYSRQIFLWIMEELSAGSGKARVGEKTPGHWAFIERLLEWFPEAMFIHVHRDPRDVVASLRNEYWWVPKSALSSAMYLPNG